MNWVDRFFILSVIASIGFYIAKRVQDGRDAAEKVEIAKRDAEVDKQKAQQAKSEATIQMAKAAQLALTAYDYKTAFERYCEEIKQGASQATPILPISKPEYATADAAALDAELQKLPANIEELLRQGKAQVEVAEAINRRADTMNEQFMAQLPSLVDAMAGVTRAFGERGHIRIKEITIHSIDRVVYAQPANFHDSGQAIIRPILTITLDARSPMIFSLNCGRINWPIDTRDGGGMRYGSAYPVIVGVTFPWEKLAPQYRDENLAAVRKAMSQYWVDWLAHATTTK